MWVIRDGSWANSYGESGNVYWLENRETYPTGWTGTMPTFAEAEILCDQLNIRDYGRVAD